MAYKSYKKKSEVTHHRSKALGKDVTATFGRFLALLTTLGGFQALKQLLELIDVKVVIAGALTGRGGVSHLRLED